MLKPQYTGKYATWNHSYKNSVTAVGLLSFFKPCRSRSTFSYTCLFNHQPFQDLRVINIHWMASHSRDWSDDLICHFESPIYFLTPLLKVPLAHTRLVVLTKTMIEFGQHNPPWALITPSKQCTINSLVHYKLIRFYEQVITNGVYMDATSDYVATQEHDKDFIRQDLSLTTHR